MVSLAFRLAPPWGYFNPALYLFSILFSTHCTGSQWKHWRRGARCSYTRLVHQEQQGENTSYFQILEWRILAHVLQTILLLCSASFCVRTCESHDRNGSDDDDGADGQFLAENPRGRKSIGALLWQPRKMLANMQLVLSWWYEVASTKRQVVSGGHLAIHWVMDK